MYSMVKDRRVGELTPDTDYFPQQWRLAQYFRTATVASSALQLFFCTLCFTDPNVIRRHVLQFSVIAVPCFTVSAIPMMLTWQAKAATLPTQRVNRLRLNRLCATVYASAVLLMLAPVGLLLLRDKTYAIVMIPFLPVGVVLYLLLRKGARLGFAWGTAQYEPHDHDLRCFFTLAAGVTVPAYVGLLGHVISQIRSSRAHVQDGINSVECLLLYAVVAGLILMLLTSSPPALLFRLTREVLVTRFLGVLADTQLALVGLAGLAAAAEIVRGFAVLALTVDVVVACAVFAREHEDEPDHGMEQNGGKHPLQHATASSPDVAPLLLNSVAFAVLMLSYSTFTGGHFYFSWQKRAGVIAVASLLVGNLTRMALQYCKAGRTDSVTLAASLLRKVNNVVVAMIVVVGVVMLLNEPLGMLASLQKHLFSLVC